jgi:predicted DNA binding CopG/RHH family protein
MKTKEKKKVTDAAVADYWEKHDATEIFDLNHASRVNAIYEPPIQSISLRLPLPLLTKIKRVAANMDIAYQALIKIWLSEKAKEVGK